MVEEVAEAKVIREQDEGMSNRRLPCILFAMQAASFGLPFQEACVSELASNPHSPVTSALRRKP